MDIGLAFPPRLRERDRATIARQVKQSGSGSRRRREEPAVGRQLRRVDDRPGAGLIADRFGKGAEVLREPPYPTIEAIRPDRAEERRKVPYLADAALERAELGCRDGVDRAIDLRQDRAPEPTLTEGHAAPAQHVLAQPPRPQVSQQIGRASCRERE